LKIKTFLLFCLHLLLVLLQKLLAGIAWAVPPLAKSAARINSQSLFPRIFRLAHMAGWLEAVVTHLQYVSTRFSGSFVGATHFAHVGGLLRAFGFLTFAQTTVPRSTAVRFQHLLVLFHRLWVAMLVFKRSAVTTFGTRWKFLAGLWLRLAHRVRCTVMIVKV
jgi:hypothetical protein